MPDLTIHVDREALARYGLNASDVRQGVEAGGSGAVISPVIDGQKRYDVAMRFIHQHGPLDASSATIGEYFVSYGRCTAQLSGYTVS